MPTARPVDPPSSQPSTRCPPCGRTMHLESAAPTVQYGNLDEGRVLIKSAFCKRDLVNVRFAPKATEVPRCREAPLCAMCRRLRVGKENLRVADLVGAAMC